MTQQFEEFPALAFQIERMANTGSVGTVVEWNRFLGALNDAFVVCAADERKRLARMADPCYSVCFDNGGEYYFRYTLANWLRSQGND
jgi:hypothetical protein